MHMTTVPPCNGRMPITRPQQPDMLARSSNSHPRSLAHYPIRQPMLTYHYTHTRRTTKLHALPDDASLVHQIQQVLRAHAPATPDSTALQHMLTQQQALYQRELARWDEERAAWDRKEAALQEQIRHLQVSRGSALHASCTCIPQDVIVSLALQHAAAGSTVSNAATTPGMVVKLCCYFWSLLHMLKHPHVCHHSPTGRAARVDCVVPRMGLAV